MDHSEAADGRAVERYLLGEMAEAEARSFELHFFECAECTEELTAGAILAENIRAVSAAEDAPLPVPVRQKSTGMLPWWRRPLFAAPAFAALALAFVTVYQANELARRAQPQALLAVTLKSGIRGAADGNRVPAGRPNLEIRVDLTGDPFPAYRCVLRDGSGRRYFAVDSESPAAGDPLSILVPQGLPRGSYILGVQGLRGSQTGPEAQYPVEAVGQ